MFSDKDKDKLSKVTQHTKSEREAWHGGHPHLGDGDRTEQGPVGCHGEGTEFEPGLGTGHHLQ